MIERKCPSCGAMVPFLSSIALLAVCPYCRALSQRKDLDLEKLGVSAQLQPDGTVIQVRAMGQYKGDSFQVLGRVQLKTPSGFWNEWFLLFNDGRQGWLGEAQGTYAVSFKLAEDGPILEGLNVGAPVALGGKTYTVREIIEAKYLAAEGELPFRPPLGESAPSADCIAEGRWFATIDYSEKPAVVFAGQYQSFDDLKLTGLKQLEGWA